MAKTPVNVRIDPGLLAEFDAWCERTGRTRTSALAEYMERQVRPAPRPPRAEPTLGAVSKHGRAMAAGMAQLREVEPNFK